MRWPPLRRRRAPPAAEPPRPWRERAFRSLRVPNYRTFFTGHAVSVTGTWMQRVAQDWLVLELSDSAVAVGVATALQAVPTLLLGVWGGVLVDRLDRRRTIMGTQAVSAVLAAVLAVLTLTGAVQLWMVFGLAFGLGLVTVLDGPARQAFITEMVGPEDYVNAQSLNSTIHNLGRLLGPAAAGLLIAWAGSGLAFAVNAASFVGVLASLWRIDPDRLHRREPAPRRRGQAMEALRYVWRRPDLRACMLLVTVVALFGQNFRVVLPVFARDVLGGGAETYGWLTSALGAGAVIGALGSAARERVSTWSLLLWTGGFSGASMLLAGAPGLAIALGLLVGLGVTNICFNTLARVLLQLGVDASMQGRVMALHATVFLGSTPIGGPLLGWICEQFSARAGLFLSGVAPAVAALALLPTLRRLRPRSDEPPAPDQAVEPGIRTTPS
ncbi:MFS transporter [Blastococcus haudaquaticus]|uniref:Predicted arabinose efflux permease, MFS family n=1 Tax=Blastococcus haudaquaticus TaxID=1938745 RepID=A0A286GGS1_9ACTN|nr:MFS transporter [Blastococcus haudaquaticus]SOD94723.1 Predicted arabinose efflux permease, MFS family [Blastococcus haudaquaticus]